MTVEVKGVKGVEGVEGDKGVEGGMEFVGEVEVKGGVMRLGERVISRRVIPSRRERLSMPAAL